MLHPHQATKTETKAELSLSLELIDNLLKNSFVLPALEPTLII